MDSMEQVIIEGSKTPAASSQSGNSLFPGTYKRMFYFDSEGLHRKQLKKKGKDALLSEIVGLVSMAKKAGANFTEIHEATIKAYGPRAAKRLLQNPDDLLFTEPTLVHIRPLLDYERTPDSFGRDFRGQATLIGPVFLYQAQS